ncbi:MAG: hypothetical protein HY261_02890, partial [Chloroflexi bacterium]|nr:hypothetical protein [Chloroflexota bacterium]
EAIEQAAAKQVIVLPNNSNVVRTAKQAAEMCASKQALVTATHDMAQGIAALMAYNYERGAESNLASMERAVAEVRTGEVTEAVRDALIDGVKVRKGDYLALAGGKVAVAAKTLVSATLELLEHLKAGQDRAVTLYYGAAVAEPEAAKVVAAVAKRWPGIDAQAVAGGQPHYHFLAAVE